MLVRFKAEKNRTRFSPKRTPPGIEARINVQLRRRPRISKIASISTEAIHSRQKANWMGPADTTFTIRLEKDQPTTDRAMARVPRRVARNPAGPAEEAAGAAV